MTLLRLYKGLLPITHTGMETTFKAARPMSPALPKSLQFVHVFPRNKHSTSLKPAVITTLCVLQAGYVASERCHVDTHGESLCAETKS